jgi:hypothetical protein
MNTNSKLVIFADDMSALITASHLNYLPTKSVYALIQVDVWFTVNGLFLIYTQQM